MDQDQKIKWSVETMQMINKLNPDIQGKAFDPDWFLLRQRFEEVDRIITQRDRLCEAVREFAKTVTQSK